MYNNEMKQCIFLIFFLLCLFLSSSFVLQKIAFAQPPDQLDPHEVYLRAIVVAVVSSSEQKFAGSLTHNQTLRVKLLDGAQKGKIVTLNYSTDATFGIISISSGQTIIVDSRVDPGGYSSYTLYAPYRLISISIIVGIFILLLLVVAGKKGMGSLLGLMISLATIIFYILPQILLGHDPLTVCLQGSLLILFLTTYIAHGVSIKTTVSVISTALALCFAVMLSILFLHLTNLFGFGDQDAYAIQLATTRAINIRGLLLGSIMIGTLGALNDVTTTQSITIFTFARENPQQHYMHLFKKSMQIGKEHIASIVNTLVLAYAGSSLMLFLLISYNPLHFPLWLLLSDETIDQEIIRAIAGSCALIIAVPITTALATYVSLHYPIKQKKALH